MKKLSTRLKRYIATALTAVLLLNCVPMEAYAAGDERSFDFADGVGSAQDDKEEGEAYVSNDEDDDSTVSFRAQRSEVEESCDVEEKEVEDEERSFDSAGDAGSAQDDIENGSDAGSAQDDKEEGEVEESYSDSDETEAVEDDETEVSEDGDEEEAVEEEDIEEAVEAEEEEAEEETVSEDFAVEEAEEEPEEAALPANDKATIEGVKYINANGVLQTCTESCIVVESEVLTDDQSKIVSWGTTGTTTWYVVNADAIISTNIAVNILGDVHLILADSTSLNAADGIIVSGGNSLTIYAQSEGDNMGRLTAEGEVYWDAGIGGKTGETIGTICINGGNITAIGNGGAAGIGGAAGCSGGTVSINGGRITASGGASGIGCGRNGKDINITINGGIVTANSYQTGSSGIGHGDATSSNLDYRSGINITINGGEINTTGGNQGSNNAAIGSGYQGTINITGGKITANGRVGSLYSGGITRIGLSSTDDYILAGSYYGNVFSESYHKTDDNPPVRIYPGRIQDTSVLKNKRVIKNPDVYAVAASQCEHGTVTTDFREFPKDDTVTVTVTPEEHYAISEVSYTPEGGSKTVIPAGTDGKYSFTMPGVNVTVTASFSMIPVSYRNWTIKESTASFTESSRETYIAVSNNTTTWSDSFEEGWYAAFGDVTVEGRVSVDGNVKLILCDDAALNIPEGISVTGSSSLTVYAQDTDGERGTLSVNGVEDGKAGIGGGGTITINGGRITVNGGSGAAGIDGTVYMTLREGDFVKASSYSGTVTARGYLKTDEEDTVKLGFGAVDNTDDIAGKKIIKDTEIYSVTVTSGDNGSVTSSHAEAREGDIITLTVTPDTGYELSSLRYNSTKITPVTGKTTYKFEMPAADTTVRAAFTGIQPTVSYLACTVDPITNEVSFTEANRTLYTVIDENTTPWGDDNTESWYVVNGDVTINSRVMVKGDVHLILEDSSQLTICHSGDKNGGIYVENNSLTIYAQSTGDNMGKLTAVDRGGILGNGSSTITINGGNITAIGYDDCAGIGGTCTGGGGMSGGTITINGGTVTATGGEAAAGIGGGGPMGDRPGGSGGTITINGGTVKANGGWSSSAASGGAGIGGGGGYIGNSWDVLGGSGGIITINGGTVEATGAYGSSNGAGIGGGYKGEGGTITITGGIVKASAPNKNNNGIGIGGGVSGSEGTIKITGGQVEISKTFGTLYLNLSTEGDHFKSGSFDGAVTAGCYLKTEGDDPVIISPGQVDSLGQLNNKKIIDNPDAYIISTGEPENGVITAPEEGLKDTSVSLNVIPDPGYKVEEVSFTPEGGSKTVIEADEEGIFRFTMPASAVSVSASFLHYHSFSYSAEGAVLTASCENNGCGLSDNCVKLMIKAPEGSLVYDGNAKEASLSGLDDFNSITGSELTVSDIVYKKGADALTAAPVNVGSYTANISLGSGNDAVTASVAFTITQKTAAISWNNTSLTYNGSMQKPDATVSNLIGGDSCSVTVSGGMTNVGTDYTATAESLSNANYKLPDTGLTRSFSIGRRAVTVTAKAQTVEVGSSISKGTEQATLTGAVTGHTLSSVSLNDSGTESIGTGTITPASARIMKGTTDVTDNYDIQYETGVLTVTKIKAKITTAPTGASGLEYTGAAQSLLSTAGRADTGVIQYKLGNGAWVDGTIPKGTNAGTYTVSYRAKADDEHENGDVSEITVSIAKGTPTIDTKPVATAITYGQTLADSTLTGGVVKAGTATVTGTFAWADPTVAPAVSDSNKTGYEVIFKPDNANKDNVNEKSFTVMIVVNKADPTVTAPVAKDGLKYSGASQVLAEAGSSNGGALQYVIGTNGTTAPTSGWSTAVPSRTNAGKYYLWYKAAANIDYNASEPDCIEVTIAKTAYTGTVSASGIVSANAATEGAFVKLPSLSGVDGAEYAETGTASGSGKALISGTPAVMGEKLVFDTTAQESGTTVTITVAVTGAVNYEDYEVTVTVIARDRDDAGVSIGDDQAVTYGTTGLKISGTALNEGTNSFWVWTSSDETVATIVEENGNLVLNSVGTTTITGRYESDSTVGEASITLTVEPKSISVNWTDTELPYTGEAQKPKAEPVGVVGRDVLSAEVSVSGNAVNAGKYTATVALKGSSSANYVLDPAYAQCEFSIVKTDIADAVVTLDNVLTYTGEEQTQLVKKVELGETDITEYVTVSDNTATDAGEYRLKVTAKEDSNYSGTVSVSFNVAKKEITPVVSVSGDYVYTGSAITPEYTVKDGEDELAAEEYASTVSDNVNAGKGKITVTAAEDGNYSFETVTVEFDIARAAHEDASVSASAASGAIDAVILTELVEEGGSATVASVSGDSAILAAVAVSENVLGFTFVDDMKNSGKCAVVYVTVSGCLNYEDYTIEVSLHVNNCTHANTVSVNAVSANCTEAGYTGDIYCADCGELLEEGTAIEALGHDFGEWFTVKEPTVFEEGLEKHICSRCGAEEENKLDKLEASEEEEELIEDLGDTAISSNTTVSVDEAGYKITEIVTTISGDAVEKVTVKENGEVTYETKIWVGGLKDEYRYTGSAIKPEFHIYDGLKKLTEGKDYSVKITNNKNVGDTASVTITFKGDYKNTDKETLKFKVVPAVLGEDVKAADTAVAANGSKQTPVPNVFWAETGKSIDSKNFNVSYYRQDAAVSGDAAKLDGVTEAGVYTAVVTAKSGDFSGEMSATVTVVGDRTKLLSSASVKIEKFTYTGQEIIPASNKFTLTLAGQTLVYDHDYVISGLAGNVEPGKATVIFEAKEGNSKGLAGTKTANFTITKGRVLDRSEAFVYGYETSVPFAKGGAKPAFTVTDNGRVLKEGVDYTVKAKNNKKVGNNATLVIKGKGKYKGTLEFKYAVTPKNLAALSDNAIAADKVQSNKGYKDPKITVTDNDGKKLAKKDFAIDGNSYSVSGDVITVDIVGSGNYEGCTTVSYRYISADKNIGKAKAKKIAAQEFNGYEVTLSMEVMTGVIYTGSKSAPKYLVPGVDFVVESYQKNTRTGTAKVTLRGIGEYGGTKTLSFKITAKKGEWKGRV